ncbi:uncharacterized protein LOC128674002 [Plodia interpunctella]|uniref:uncharacterized protein LOC128674002 n=1 Tax=Plodia interpunctella TaxID=58824 RepID=UPI0023682FCE|nr:uncharacterized protein LOC128674002 [Plodia interpunctella]
MLLYVGNCCCSLRWSTLFIALIYMVLSVPLMVTFGTPVFLYKVYGADIEISTLFSFCIICLSLILQFAAGVFLVVATIQKSAVWMWPWIWVSFLQSAGLISIAAVCTFIYIYQVTKGEIPDDPEEPKTYAAFTIYGIVLYFATSVVNSYKRDLYPETASNSVNEQAEMAPLSAV